MTAEKPNNFILEPRHAQRINEGLASYKLIFRAEILEQIIPELLEDATIKGNEQKDPLILIRQKLDEQIRNLLGDNPHKISQLFVRLLEEEKLFEQDAIAAKSQQLCDDFFDHKIGFEEAIAEIQTICEQGLKEAIVLNQTLGEGDEAQIAQAQAKDLVFANGKDTQDRSGNFFNRSTGRALINGNLLFRNSLQKWFAKIGKEIKSDDKTTIASELIKRIGLEEDTAVTPQNIIALSEGYMLANRHLAKCLTAQVPTDILKATPFRLSSRANFYSFATSDNQYNSQVIEASSHPTTYPFGPNVLAFKEQIWQMRTTKAISPRNYKNISCMEIPYVEKNNIKMPYLPSRRTLNEFIKLHMEDSQDEVEALYDKYNKALWEILPQTGTGRTKHLKASEISDPYDFLRLYLKSISNEKLQDFSERFSISTDFIQNKIDHKARSKSPVHDEHYYLSAKINLDLRRYFTDNIKKPKEFGIDSNYLDKFFPIPTKESIQQINTLPKLMETWKGIIGISSEEFALKINNNLKTPVASFYGWSNGIGLDKYINKICDFIRNSTQNNTALPQFTEEAEAQLRSATIIKQEEFKAKGKEKYALKKAQTGLCKTTRIKTGINLGLGEEKSLEL